MATPENSKTSSKERMLSSYVALHTPLCMPRSIVCRTSPCSSLSRALSLPVCSRWVRWQPERELNVTHILCIFLPPPATRATHCLGHKSGKGVERAAAVARKPPRFFCVFFQRICLSVFSTNAGFRREKGISSTEGVISPKPPS